MKLKLREAGFTLAEALAALTFMAILIPVAIEGLHVASRAGEVAARKSEAALVAESVLTNRWLPRIMQNGQSGTVRQGVHEFHWTIRNDPWNQDAALSNMRLLSVQVDYTVQGRKYDVHLSTLVDSAPATVQPITTQQ